MAADDEPPDNGEIGDHLALEPFDPDLIRDLMEEAINAIVREQGLLNAAWDELEHREQVIGMKIRRMKVMTLWLESTPDGLRLPEFSNDNG